MNQNRTKKIRVMLVEDNDDHAFIAKQCLLRSTTAIDIEVFPEGREALEHLESHMEMPALVLLDLDLPGMDGLSFLRELRTLLGRTTIPVILLTSSMDEQKIRQAYQFGAAGFVNKPLSAPQNLQKLQNYLDLLQIPITVWPYGHILSSEPVVM
ncbi:MAG: response regulator [candidate division KSB1 bacterium]|nr:response regulator [candidate division KSB1 bacterium]MDQ7065633.1 response regulator [candidate division KSB1 bacterium]